MRNRLLVLLAIVCGATSLLAQAPPPITTLRLTGQATRFVDSLANETRTTRTETAGCLTGYTVQDSTLTVSQLSPATYQRADSLTIWGDQPICPDGTPSLHSHLMDITIPGPSQTDLNTNARRGIWGLLLSVYPNGYIVQAYP